MARPATTRRPTDGRTRRLDRPTRRCLPGDPGHPSVVGSRPSPDGDSVPAAPEPALDQAPPADVTPEAFWALLPANERERFGLRLSRLVLRAVRCPDSCTAEDV
jgi:hypothetical protein